MERPLRADIRSLMRKRRLKGRRFFLYRKQNHHDHFDRLEGGLPPPRRVSILIPNFNNGKRSSIVVAAKAESFSWGG